jgi:signal transduction histidine kinase
MSVGGTPTAAAAADGRLWFVTSSGVVAWLDPRNISRNRFPPPVHIESVFVDDRPASATSSAQLPPLSSRIEIDYTGLSLATPRRVTFRYRLEGFDRVWIDAGTRRQAVYTNLPPRKYRFSVIAENNGVWNEQGASWDFSIEPTFYQTTWFWSALLAVLLCAATATWRLRVRNVKAQFALVLAERARVAREIHDTLLQSLVGVAFQFDTAFSQLDESLPDAKTRLLRLRDQIERAIREARDSIWELRSPAKSRTDLPSSLHEIGERTSGSSVSFSLQVHGELRTLSRRVEQALLRIATEAISNAARHALATKIAVDLTYSAHSVTLCVCDDGCGLEEAAPSEAENHWGLQTMRERAAQIRAQFTLRSRPAEGTAITVVVPDSQLEDSE